MLGRPKCGVFDSFSFVWAEEQNFGKWQGKFGRKTQVDKEEERRTILRFGKTNNQKNTNHHHHHHTFLP